MNLNLSSSNIKVGIIFSMIASFLLTTILATTSFFHTLISTGKIDDSFISFLVIIVGLGVISNAITLVVTLFVGAPITVVLKYFNCYSLVNIVSSGAIIGYFLMSSDNFLRGPYPNVYLTVLGVTYGAISSYGFYKGIEE